MFIKLKESQCWGSPGIGSRSSTFSGVRERYFRISESLLSLTRLYADDSSLFYSATNLNDIEGIINHDLRILVNWAAQWLINFNPLKTEAILFTLKLLEQLPHITFDGTPIEPVTEHKHLGPTLSNNGQWHSHIDNIISNASKVGGALA